MWNKAKAWASASWERIKQAFGRSRTIAINVFGIFGMVFVESSDYLTSFQWDDFFKHEVALTIAAVIQVLNVVIRIYTTGPVNFSSPVVASVEQAIAAEPEAPQSPKAM